MITFCSHLRSLRSVIVFATVILLPGALWVVGTHDHAPSRAHSCAVCTTAHAPSIVNVVATSVSAPHPILARIPERPTSAPAPVAFGIASSRAPPQG